jgi:hypothetical protein
MMKFAITRAWRCSYRTTSWRSSVLEQIKIVHGGSPVPPLSLSQCSGSGCLTLVLAITTTILKNLRYPLLPHQTVHKALCQLIVNAAALSQKYTAMMKSVPEQKLILQAYIRKIGKPSLFSAHRPGSLLTVAPVQTPISWHSSALCGSESLSTQTSSPSSDSLTQGERSSSLL